MLQFAIPCLLGLESLVGDEVKKLGLADIRVENGRVLCRGEERDLARLNINLRCGARVLLVLADFRATDFETLFQGTRAVRWEDWVPREGEFPVTGYSINSTLHSVPACQSIVKKAVVERLGAAYGLQTLPETGKRYQIRFSIMKDEVMLCLDASGEGLYKRGYRAVGVAAPLKETLAAAMVKLSHYNGRDPFCDPFCGSGTLLIEAAQKAMNIAPGLKRRFAAERYSFVPASIWAEQRQKALAESKLDVGFEAFGYDIDPAAIRGQGRTKATSWARHIAIYLTRHMTKLSLKDIGKEFDNRDHTTILHSIDRVEKQCKSDPETNEVIKDIRSNINERYN